jgi:hypothetical protein
MGKSFRRTPIFRNTTARSEKWGKAITHRRFRKRNKQLLKREMYDTLLNKPYEAFEPLGMEKDGKRYRADAPPKEMRK